MSCTCRGPFVTVGGCRSEEEEEEHLEALSGDVFVREHVVIRPGSELKWQPWNHTPGAKEF
mgnify:CR=1 FL=1